MTHTQQAKKYSFFGNTLYIFLIRFFPALASLLILVRYARALDAADYGAYQNFWVQYYVLSTVACAGIPVLLLTYPPAVMVKLVQRTGRKVLAGLLMWAALCGIVFAWLQAGTVSYTVSFFFLLINACIAVAESALSVYRRFRILAVVNILYALLFVWLHEQVLRQGFDAGSSYTTLFLYLSGAALIRLVCYLFTLPGLLKKTPVDKEEMNMRQVRYLWLHMGLYDTLQVAFRWADKFFVSLLLTAAFSAVYFNGSVDIPFLPLVLGAAGSAGLMQLAAHTGNGLRAAHARGLALQSGRILSCIVFPLFFFLLFFRYELFAVVFKDRYAAAVPIFLVSLLSVPLRAYSFTTILQHYHKGRIINTGAVLDIVLACLLMWPMYRLAGLPGVAFAFTITSYIQAGYYLYHTALLLDAAWWQLLPLKNWTIKLIIFFMVFISLHYLSVGCLNNRFALILGIFVLLAGVLVALLYELNSTRHHYGETGTQE